MTEKLNSQSNESLAEIPTNSTGADLSFSAFAFEHPWVLFASFCVLLTTSLLLLPWPRFLIQRFVRNRSIQKIKLSQFEIEFNAHDRKEMVNSLHEVSNLIQNYRKKIEHKISQVIDKESLDGVFETTANKILKAVENEFDPQTDTNIRITLHISDFVFKDEYLFQLVDYYPKTKSQSKKYRVFPLRRGIIGRVWRSRIPALSGFLTENIAEQTIVDADPEFKSSEELLEKICLEWGATKEDVVRFVDRPSYGCFPVFYIGVLRGLIYFDTTKPNFGKKDLNTANLMQLRNNLETIISESQLGEVLDKIHREMSDYAPSYNLR